MIPIFKKLCLAAIGAGFIAGFAHAGVIIEETRVIFPGQEREVTLKLSNKGASPVLVQTWFDKGEADAPPESIDVPFNMTPSMFRMDPNKGQTLRIIYTKEPLPQDKETLFWLNVLEIPPKGPDDGGSKLQLSFRSRIKLMFRPQGLPGSAAESPAKVSWEVVPAEGGKGLALRATNPTPYFVNLGQVELVVGGKRFDAGGDHVAPGGSRLFPVAGLSERPAPDAVVEFMSINDYGGLAKGQRALGQLGVPGTPGAPER